MRESRPRFPAISTSHHGAFVHDRSGCEGEIDPWYEPFSGERYDHVKSFARRCRVRAARITLGMGAALELDVDGTIYHCYATTTGDGDERVDTYVVAGLGRISIDRDSGEVASIVALTPSGVPILKRLAHVRSPQRERQVPNLITARLLSRAIRCKVAGCASRSSLPLASVAAALACSSTPPAPPGAITFHKDVEPILQKSCQMCHVPGGIAPFSLTTYADAKPYAADMVLQTQNKVMPPWGAQSTSECTPRFPWKNDVRLSDQELATIKAWHDGGDWEGNPADAPPPHHGAAGHVARRRAAARRRTRRSR